MIVNRRSVFTEAVIEVFQLPRIMSVLCASADQHAKELDHAERRIPRHNHRQR
jgi:hypothetical protein